MKIPPSITLIISLLIPNFCNGQQINLTSYNKLYDVKKIPEIESFLVLNKEEIKMQERYSSVGNTTKKESFQTNRSRMFMDAFRNGVVQKKDSIYYKGLPTPCNCQILNDTIFINMGIGFFGGLGFTIKIYKDHFESSFYEYTDDVKPYKTNLNDTAFYSQIEVKNKYQSLIFDSKPEKKEQQITGLLTCITSDFYKTRYSNSLDTLHVNGKIYFTYNDKIKTKCYKKTYFSDPEKKYGFYSSELRDEIDKGLKLDSTIAFLWEKRSEPLMKIGKYEIGMKYLDKAVKYDTLHWLAYRDL